MDSQDTLQLENLWNQPVYAQFWKQIDPFCDLQYFRPLDRAYSGDNTFWSIPSPEPDLDDEFWALVNNNLDNNHITQTARLLAQSISQWEPDNNKLIFAAILRAGVPVADWLCRLLPGAKAVAMSLFVGLGIDKIALKTLKENYPDRTIIFVDGWTGRGGVARAIKELNQGPLAVLIDPWGWADFSGVQEDIFCPTACFTGASTLGFSRTFFVNNHSMFAAFRFPQKYCQNNLVKSWQKLCPSFTFNQKVNKNLTRFFKETKLRLHSNEVCRALINADPKKIYFADDKIYVKEHFPLLLALATRRQVKVEYCTKDLNDYKTRVACELNIHE